MKATLGVQLDGAVRLQMQRLCPVVGEDLCPSAYYKKKVQWE
jgi:hypothetical protein